MKRRKPVRSSKRCSKSECSRFTSRDDIARVSCGSNDATIRSGSKPGAYRFDLLVVEQDRDERAAAVAEDTHSVHRDPIEQLARLNMTAYRTYEIHKHA